MFGKDKNRYEMNIKAERPAKVISLKDVKKRKEKMARRHDGTLLTMLGQMDLSTPWVMRLLAVVFILILSMLIL